MTIERVIAARNAGFKYEPAPRFTPERDLSAIFSVIKECSVPGSSIVEIGCNEGVCTRDLALQFPDRRIFGVDTDNPRMHKSQASENPKPGRIGCHARHMTNATVIVASSGDLRLDLDPFDNVGVVYVDGDHSFGGVRADSLMVFEFFSTRGGVVIWHDDHEHCPDWCGVHEFLNAQRLFTRIRIPETIVSFAIINKL